MTPPPASCPSEIPPQARNRLIALKTAKASAAIQQAAEAAGASPEGAEEASEHGGERAFKYLAAMQSLRRIDATSVQELCQEALEHRRRSRDGANGANGGASAGASPTAAGAPGPGPAPGARANGGAGVNGGAAAAATGRGSLAVQISGQP